MHTCDISRFAVPPDILYGETSTDVSVREGDNASLVCRATGHPAPKITWRREDSDHILLRKNSRDVVKGRCPKCATVLETCDQKTQ